MQKSAYIAILAICSFHFVYTQNPAQDGQWSDPVGFGIVPVAVANLPDGRLITWSSKFRDTFGGQDGATFTEIFDPFLGANGQALGEFTANTNHDMFCPGINNLPDGRILSAGGSSSERTSIYDPVTGLWEVADDMNIPRGYQGNVTLSNGSVFTLGGSWSGNGNSGARDAEIWTESTGWVVLSGIDGDDIYTGGDLSTESEGVYRADNHAWLWPASNGGLFHAGPSELMHWIDVSGNGSIVSAGQRSNDSYSMKGTTVMFDVDKILKVGGSESYSSGHPAKNNAYVIDINVPYGTAPNVTSAGQLSFSRTMHNSTVLPNGDVLVTGGLDRAEVFSDIGSRLTAELYNPSTNTWRTVAGMVTPRTYHSVAILMTDGRVFVGGGGLCDSTPGCVNHFDAEIYSPPYLFNGNGSLAARPIISAPDKANYNTGINVSGSANIQEFCLIRFSSATHSTNNEQRRIPVSHTQSQGAYNVNIPGNNLLPPGYYMLFALDGNGVPSIAETIQIGANVANNQDQSLILDIGFDEGQGTMSFDRSSFGNDLSFFDTDNNLGIKNPSSDNWGQGLFGGAMETDGYEFQSNTIGEVSHSQSMGALTNKITLMAWVNRDEVQHNVGIFSHDYPSIFFGFHNSLYKWEFPTDTGGEASCYAGYSPPGQWVHVAATYDGNNAILYANGVEISRMPVQGNFILNPNESNFSTFTTSGFYQRLQNPSGNYNGSGVTDELDGRIDELKVYNRVLSRNEIVSQYLQGQLQNNPNLADCSQNSIVAEYMIGNNGAWIEGNNIEVSDGETVYIRAKGYSGEYFLTTPQKDGPTFSSVDDLSNHNAFNAYQVDTYVYNFGNPERNNGLVDPTNYGKFVLTTANGCPTVVNLNTEVPPSNDCPPGTTQVIQEYRINGEWLSGSDHITVEEGTEVMLSILPNTLGVSITLPGGTVVGDDYNLGNVDISDSGDYLLTSSEGCTVTLTLQVTSEGGSSAPVAVATASPLTGNPPLEVSFTGSGSTDDVGVVSHSWDFGDGGSSTLADPVHTYSSPGSYTATLTVQDGEGETDVDTVSITVTQEGSPGECTALSAPWSNSDVGSVLAGGSACSDGQTYEVSGSGADIWGSSDGFHYVYQQLEGDLEITARVVSLSNTDNWAKAGVMVRNNLSGNSAMALMSVSPDPSYGSGPGYTLQHRSVDGGTMTSSGHNLGPVHVGMPYYVRLVREGDTFSGYASANGTDWSLLGSRQIPMGNSVYVGLAVTSHKNGVLADAVLDNVTVTGGSSSGGNSAPVAVATASPLTGNPPLEVSFTGSGSTDDVGVVSHSWDFGDGGSSTLADPVHTYSSPGSYTATLTVQDGEGRVDSSTIGIVVTDPNYCETGTIIPEYRLDGVWSSGLNDLTVVEGTEVMFSILPNTVGVTVTLADGTVVGDDFNLGPVTVSHSGPYVLLSSEGCETTINLTVVPDTLGGRSGVSTGQIDQSSGGFTFNSLESLGTRIFPNPTRGYFKISNYELVGETVRVMIYGTSNRLIFEKEFPNFPGEIELESLYFFQDGIYRVLVSSSNHLTSHSLILKK